MAFSTFYGSRNRGMADSMSKNKETEDPYPLPISTEDPLAMGTNSGDFDALIDTDYLDFMFPYYGHADPANLLWTTAGAYPGAWQEGIGALTNASIPELCFNVSESYNSPESLSSVGMYDSNILPLAPDPLCTAAEHPVFKPEQHMHPLLTDNMNHVESADEDTIFLLSPTMDAQVSSIACLPPLPPPPTDSTSGHMLMANRSTSGGDGRFECPVLDCRLPHHNKKALCRHILARVEGDQQHKAAARALGLKMVKSRCRSDGCAYATYRLDNLTRHEKTVHGMKSSRRNK